MPGIFHNCPNQLAHQQVILTQKMKKGGNRAELYRGMKQYFSVNVQTVCDSELLIRNIAARWPGSVHDRTIFNNSRLRARFEAAEIAEGMLLGDNGYPLRKNLITPLLHIQSQTRAE